MNNNIPIDEKSSNDAIIIEFGRVLRKLDLSDIEFCRLLAFIEDLRQETGYESHLEIKGEISSSQIPKIRTKKHHFITNEKVARLLGFKSPKGFRNKKARIVKWINNLSKILNGN
ncbi:MAG: hypothetical protein V1871_02705 [Planctomycetota bacterium]